MFTAEERRSASVGVPGELELAPTIVRVRLFEVVSVLLQAPPDPVEQIGVKVAPPLVEYSASRPAFACGAQASPPATTAMTVREFLLTGVSPDKYSR
jgi:hypothetical protein